MPKDNPEYPDMYDWELESRAHYQRMMDDAEYEERERLPARIIVKIKTKKDANQTNKRAFRGDSEERVQP
jgi:hypothetical protein